MSAAIRRTRRRPADRGFSLIEVMIALVVFSIGALALGVIVPLGTNKTNNAGRQTRASELAGQCAEQLLTTPYSDGDLTVGTHNDTNNPYPGSYYIQWVVEDDQPITKCKRVTVSVYRLSLASAVAARVVIVTPESGG